MIDTERTVVPVAGPGRVPVVVIGVGNEFRRDDGAGPAVIGPLRDLVSSGVELVITDGEPTRLIEAWTGAALAVVVNAVRAEPPQPGRAIVSWWTGQAPTPPGQRVRTASASMTRSPWPWRWTGCPAASSCTRSRPPTWPKAPA